MNENQVVSPLMPVPPIGLMALVARGYSVCFDAGEHFVKQTVRNRYHILSPNGIQTLTVAVVGQKGNKIPTGRIRLDYREPWVREHKRALETSYRSAPFFDHYYPEVRLLLDTEYPDLLAFFRAGFKLWCKLLKLNTNYRLEEVFVEREFKIDLRRRIKQPKDFPTEFWPRPYIQVFEDRFDFQPNLSVVDLLFNQGPEALSALKT